MTTPRATTRTAHQCPTCRKWWVAHGDAVRYVKAGSECIRLPDRTRAYLTYSDHERPCGANCALGMVR